MCGREEGEISGLAFEKRNVESEKRKDVNSRLSCRGNGRGSDLRRRDGTGCD